MAEWVKVAETGDIPPNRGKRIEVGGLAIAVFNLDSQFFALEDTCPRDDGSLSQGDLFGDLVQCPIEACKYELATGANLPAETSSAVTMIGVLRPGTSANSAAPTVLALYWALFLTCGFSR